MSWKDEYPHLYELFLATDVQHPDNYFARMDGLISLGAAQSYRDLEERFSRLDSTWRRNIIERAAPFVTRRDIETGRHWTALFETLNEVNGYVHLQELGYSEVRFIRRASHPTPDLHGSASFGDALLEVKTVNLSDENLANFGLVQQAHDGLPDGLKRKLRSDYATARQQLHSLSVREPTRRFCAFYIDIDLRVVLARANLQALIDFMESIQSDCEIYHHSQHW
jgi:hypothetical protein